jgi:anti-sigma regulatory factor (Ser/Thr protein kinase)
LKKRKLIVPAEIKYLAQIRNFVNYIGRRYAYSNKDIHATMLAVEEACANIMRHGYKGIADGQITVKILVRRMCITVILIDQGQSFDPRTVNKPDLFAYVEMGKVGGLGIMMIRKLMDELRYDVTARGNEFRLTKYRERVQRSPIFKMWRFSRKHLPFRILFSHAA